MANCTEPVPKECRPERLLNFSAADNITSITDCCVCPSLIEANGTCPAKPGCLALPQKCKDLFECESLCYQSDNSLGDIASVILGVLFWSLCACGRVCIAILCVKAKKRQRKTAVAQPQARDLAGQLNPVYAVEDSGAAFYDDMGCKPKLICFGEGSFKDKYIRQDPCLSVCYLPEEKST